MNIDYTKLPRLAELCESVSDRAIGNDGLDVGLKINNRHATPYLSVTISRWEGFKTTRYTMCTSPIGLFYGETPISAGDMVEVLEQIHFSGFAQGIAA